MEKIKTWVLGHQKWTAIIVLGSVVGLYVIAKVF